MTDISKIQIPEGLKRAHPTSLRTSLEAGQAMAKIGVEFVPLPVLGANDHSALADQMVRRMEVLAHKAESGLEYSLPPPPVVLDDHLEQIKHLARGAKEAAPGDPWYYDEKTDAYTHVVRVDRTDINNSMIVAQLGQSNTGRSEALARYFAGVNPDVIGRLVAEVERARGAYQLPGEYTPRQIAQALEFADWSGVPAKQKALITAAINALLMRPRQAADTETADLSPFVCGLCDNRHQHLETCTEAEARLKAAALSPDLVRVYDVIGLHHSQPLGVLLTNFENIKRFSDLLHAVEYTFFMVPGEPSDEPEDEGAPVDDVCVLNSWGLTNGQYLEQFRKVLADRDLEAVARHTSTPLLSDDEVCQLAEEAFGQVVDYDLKGNPITDYRVLLMGAYGPAIRRLVNMARQHPAVAVWNQAEPYMWANESDDTIPHATKQHNLSLGGAPAAAVSRYTIPLFREAPGAS